jgi:radical SAM superfamily enzyme YgiQ (UPF0313 family)
MIVLFNPQSAPPGKTYLPLSLLALGAVLEGKSEYAIVDGNLEPDPARRIIEILREQGGVLGVTVMPGPQLKQAIEVCPKIRAALSEVTIVWGGYFPTEHTEVCLRASYVDYVVRGQGEETFLELLVLLEQKTDPANIKGLSYKRDGQILHNPERALISPQKLPPLPYHRVPVEQYLIQTAVGQRTLPYNSSFGCPFYCNFCAVVKMVDGGWLAETGEHTAAGVRYLHEHFGADSIIFVDNNFFASEKRVRRYAETLLEMGLEGKIGWWGEGRVDTLIKYRPETWQVLKKAGCAMIFMGAESGSDETLTRMNKGGKASVAATLEIARRLKEYGIVPEFSFILGNPPDPAADIRSTFGFIKQVKQINPATEIILYLYSPVPVEGELLDAATSGGFRFPQTLEEWLNEDWREFAHRHNPHTPWLRESDRRKVLDFNQVLNAYYPTTTNPRLAGWRGKLVKSAASWRYLSGFYRYPLELKALDKVLGYQRQDTRAC